MEISTGDEEPTDAVNAPHEGLGTRIARRFVGIGLAEPLPEVHSPLCDVPPGPGELAANHNLDVCRQDTET